MKIHVKQSQPLKIFLLIIISLTIITVAFAKSSSITTAASGWIAGVQWLLGQQVPNPIVPNSASGRSGLVISYSIPPSDPNYPFLFNRSWIYDDSLAVISWSMEGECQAAKRTLSSLVNLLDSEGKLGFSYNTADLWFDNARYRTGAIAWVGYTVIFYQRLCGDSQFYPSAEKIADWVLTMQDPAKRGSVKGGPDPLGSSFWSTEHNIDAYFLLRDIGLLSNRADYLTAADQIKQSLLDNHWNAAYGCFQAGYNDTDKVLDAASWGALFLLRIGQLDKVNSCLDFIEANFSTTVNCTIGGVSQTISGYKPDPGTNLVWSEGSLGVALAYLRAGNQAKHHQIITEIWKMQGPNGGIVYACPPNPAKEFSNWESVAGTAWMVILQSSKQDAFWNLPLLALSKQATPNLVQDGAPLTYTIRITNTGSMALTATVTDTLPAQVTPTGILTWTPTILPGDVWVQQVIVTVQSGFSGTLINLVEVTSQEGATGRTSVITCANVCKNYLPILLKGN